MLNAHPITGFVGAEITDINLDKTTRGEIRVLKEEWREQQFLAIAHFDSNFSTLTSSLIGGLRSSAG